ncbi:NAD(P)H dehydrogenase (quinone) [Pseudoclavibacter endophyticus]|uniref:Flavodoxin family protein n=1 Tax=Pseudoclavibacter endophyticus TaxID=1778590 RepID=A0A6H9WDJ6_9MICO|nr:NAD(P)H-dependent oxidoreductase [Pseudoclavibacter endophyticus]KAB1649022.1 flavodoxin family protein [Pseudoclavibacter endophyticus]GGA66153.1 NAD(P)H dehydrogenase (quinone) [Pseudoclavibacter endophyticus]
MSETLVIDGHPNATSFCAAIAQSYLRGDPAARLLPLRDLEFDVHMRHGYTKRMPIEPDLADAREAIRRAEHLVVVTPVWWRSTPALLKGFLDRALLPQEEYRYTDRGLPEGLLSGRSARVFMTSDTPLALQRLMPDTRLNSLTKGTLAFCGLSPVRATRFAPVKGASAERRAQWLERVERIAREESASVRGGQRSGTPEGSAEPTRSSTAGATAS